MYARHRDVGNELNLIGWLILILYVLMKMSNEFQKVYMIFGLVRSPLYDTFNKNSLCNVVWQNIRTLMVHFGIGLVLTFYAKALILKDIVLEIGK